MPLPPHQGTRQELEDNDVRLLPDNPLNAITPAAVREALAFYRASTWNLAEDGQSMGNNTPSATALYTSVTLAQAQALIPASDGTGPRNVKAGLLYLIGGFPGGQVVAVEGLQDGYFASEGYALDSSNYTAHRVAVDVRNGALSAPATATPSTITWANLGGLPSDSPSLVNYLTSLGQGLNELVLPQQVQGGKWYVTDSGIWAAKQTFNAQAPPQANAYWRLVVAFASGGTNLNPSAAGLRLLQAPTATAQRALLNGVSISANQYARSGGSHPGFTMEDGGSTAWLLEQVAYLLSMAAPAKAPLAPTEGEVNDTANTFSGKLVSGYSAVSDYEVFGVPGYPGTVSATTVGADIQNGCLTLYNLTGELPIGTVGFRVAASGNRPAGGSLTNDRAYTGAATQPVGTAPTITNATPNPASVGQGVTLTGTNFTGASSVTFNGVQAAFTVLNSTTISATVPAGATTGKIGVANTSATGYSLFDFTVQAATNSIPVANAGSDTTITLPSNQVVLQGSGTDADGSITAYAWRQVAGASVSGMPSSIAQPVITFTTAGTYQFGLITTDNKGAPSSEDFVMVTVNAAPVTGGGTTNVPVPYAKMGRNAFAEGELGGAFHLIRAEYNGPSLGFLQTSGLYSQNPNYAGFYVVDGSSPVGIQLASSTSQETKQLNNLPGGSTKRILTFMASAEQRVNDAGPRLGSSLDAFLVPDGYVLTLLDPVVATAANTIPIGGNSLSNAIGSMLPQTDSYAHQIELQTGWQLPMLGYGFRGWIPSLSTADHRTAELAKLARFPHTRSYWPLGVNDYLKAYGTPDQVAAAAGAWFDAYHDQYPNNIVYTHTLPTVNNNAAVNGYTPADFNDKYSQLVQGRESWLIMGNGPALYNAPHLSNDSVHYPTSSYAIIGTNLIPFLQSQPATNTIEESNLTYSPDSSEWPVDSFPQTAKTNGQTRYNSGIGASVKTPSRLCRGFDFWANVAPNCGKAKLEMIRVSDNQPVETFTVDFNKPATATTRVLWSSADYPLDNYYARMTNLGGGNNFVAVDAFIARTVAGQQVVPGPVTQVRANEPAFVADSGWTQEDANGGDAYTTTQGPKLTYTFTATAPNFDVLVNQFSGGGNLSISLNGGAPIIRSCFVNKSTPDLNVPVASYLSVVGQVYTLVFTKTDNDGTAVAVAAVTQYS